MHLYVIPIFLTTDTLKRTKSVGDLMSEIQRETDTLILDTSAKGVGNRFVDHQVASSKPRQSSQTPPPKTQNINVTERPR